MHQEGAAGETVLLNIWASSRRYKEPDMGVCDALEMEAHLDPSGRV